MPLPVAMTRFNRRVLNPLLGRLAGHVAPLALLEHRGRRSGRAFRTPIFAFQGPGEVTVALTYGSGVEWLANVRAAGECTLRHRGHRLHLGPPRMLDTATGLTRVPAPSRAVLRSARVTEFVEFPILGDSRE